MVPSSSAADLRSFALAALLATLANLAACSARAAPAQQPAGPPPAARIAPPAAAAKPEVAQILVSGGQLGSGWTDLGWAPRTVAAGQPVRLDLGKGGWILGHAAFETSPGGLLLRYRGAAETAALLDVSLDGRNAVFPRLLAASQTVLPRQDGSKDGSNDGSMDGWRESWFPLAGLNPKGLSFNRIVLRLSKPLDSAPVEIDLLAFTRNAPPSARERPDWTGPARPIQVVLDCSRTEPISPLIYGVAFGPLETVKELGATARRWGGNTTSRYNWKLGNAWNTGADWFFRNVDITSSNSTWTQFLADDRSGKLLTAFTVPTIGWVAKDTRGCSFPQEAFPDQKAFDPSGSGCGKGESPSGVPLPPGAPDGTSVAAPPSFVGDWVRAIRGQDGDPGRSARLYYLDNEPTLWHANHRDVHPERLGADELLKRTVDYAGAVKAADPQAQVAGFVAWGWTALFFSAADRAEGQHFIPQDRLLHGGRALLPWWLSKLREQHTRTGQRLVDLVDVHFYPQAAGVGLYGDGWIDADSSARRIRSVRALWDPDYIDESWIGEPVKLIPRLKAWIQEEYPGTGISIGEYNFGAEGHISGGLAVAEALGRFGVLGVEAAFYWALPPKGSPAYWAFRAFRDYDGKGAHFGERSVAATSSEKGLSSVFASRDAAGGLVLVALNHDPASAIDLTVDPGSCGPGELRRHFSADEHDGLSRAALPAKAAPVRLPPWSINVLELGPPGRPTPP